MLKILSVQMLPLVMALLGALIGAILGIALTGQPTAISKGWSATLAVLSGLTVMLVVYVIFEDIRFEQRVKAVGDKIRYEIDQASTLDYDMLQAGEKAAANQTVTDLPDFLRRQEEWRTRVEQLLARELPGSGADLRFRTASGDINRGWGVSIYTRLTVLRNNLMVVLDNLPTYVQRSQ